MIGDDAGFARLLLTHGDAAVIATHMKRTIFGRTRMREETALSAIGEIVTRRRLGWSS